MFGLSSASWPQNGQTDQSSSLTVISLLNGESKLRLDVPAGIEEFQIDASGLSKGLYGVLYYLNDEKINEKKVNVQ